jgi:hypothetical protein
MFGEVQPWLLSPRDRSPRGISLGSRVEVRTPEDEGDKERGPPAQVSLARLSTSAAVGVSIANDPVCTSPARS